MDKFKMFQRIIRGSMRYEFEGTMLTVTDWHTGQSISIDLAELSRDAFEDIVDYDDDEDDEDEEQE